jgi:hypothetical protein
MDRKTIALLFAATLLFLACAASAAAPPADGTVKITSRTASPGIGLSWGDGVLTYKGQDYPFIFQAKGLYRDVDTEITATELSGEVFNLKSLSVFNGTYNKTDAEPSGAGPGSRVTMKNLNGVVVRLASTVEGRKFVLGRDGMKIELKKEKGGEKKRPTR